jgi:drug/metabolite transporter (DMT)-like permease
VLAAVAVLGLFGTGYATVLYFRLIADLGAGRAAAVDYLVPVVAVAVGVLVNGEHVRPELVAGAVLILVGMAIGERRLPARRPTRRRITPDRAAVATRLATVNTPSPQRGIS